MTRGTLKALGSVILLASVLSAAPPADVEARKLLVGTWFVQPDPHMAVKKTSSITFMPDGTFSSYAVFRVRDEDLRIEVQGKWSIQNGVVVEEVTRSSHPQLPPVGLITRDRLLAVTDKEYRYRTEKGVEHTYIRK